MSINKVQLSFVFLLGLGFSGLQAEEILPATGGNALGSGGSATYTIGQVVYTTIIGTNGSVVQGVQQPFEISVISGIDEGTNINLACSAYPNPTTDFLILKIEKVDFSTFYFTLYDINGNLLENKEIEGNETTISIEHLVPATYFLRVSDGKNEVKTFKIIKIK